MNYLELSRKVFNVLDPRANRSRLERADNGAVSLLILANVVAVSPDGGSLRANNDLI